ncbi:hypothetical protein M408DRAFT_30931 [Serendipita vermifera MAFF 305830]|uniref:Uncharacterized protein n=1 Tax=Serendipita vermifera MAFF 305830 TaxID=933852 RepID=A0A0C3AKF9_SERVB|nr:hypothetical protein M408DRAFT_30931 [Serendipita vermifera MAFF 305830]
MAVWPSDSVDQFFSVVGPLSSLQFMEDDFPPYSQLNWEYILSQCPAFVGIKRHLDDRSPRGHTQFWVHESTAPLKDFILQLKGLGHARTLRWWPDKGIEEEIHLADHDVPSLPALTDCVIGRGINQNLYKILKSARNLTYLSIHIGDKWRHVFDLLDLCTHLPKLLTLHLTISTISEQLTAHMVHSSATNIRDLGLNYIGGQEYDEIKNMGIFFSLLPEYFGHLQDLYVSPTDLGPQLATFIASLSHLRSLYLGQMSLCNIENVVTSSPSLEILRIELKDAGTSQELLSSTNFPLLRCLKVSLSSYSRDFNVERIDLNFGSILGHLTTVHIDAPDVQWDLPDFPALRRLHVGSQYAAPATEFLANLILEPKICGLLHEIELNFIPEWDLLFLMLERRNYLPPSLGISRITTLILQSPIPPFLLAPLTYLLRGRFTERPSNLDLSFCNFMEEYFDTSLPGCWVCLRSFLPCEAPAGIYTTDQIIKPRFRPLTLLSGQFDIPTNVWEWLQDRDSRIKDLKQEYNSVSRQLDALTYSSLSDPLVALPPEIWEDILYQATRSRNISDLSCVDASLVLSLVSQDWCSKILDTPSLWTEIEIGKGNGDALANLKTAVYLSKGRDLSLDIHFIQAEWLVGTHLLVFHRDRIRWLKLFRANYLLMDKDMAIGFVHQFFSALGHLPSLQVMDGSFGLRLSWDDILARSPALIDIAAGLDPYSGICSGGLR